jgi:hypothetical protein
MSAVPSLSAGVTALPAMRKLVNVMDSKLANWDSMEELPVEIPVANEHRFHTVFSCPVSKEESTPSNPPMLLKCGHVICKSCVKKIALNMNRCVDNERNISLAHADQSCRCVSSTGASSARRVPWSKARTTRANFSFDRSQNVLDIQLRKCLVFIRLLDPKYTLPLV